MRTPLCCGEPMVHNSWTCQHECADAYFALVDAGFGEGVILERLDSDDVGTDLAATLEHWRASRIPDGLTAGATP